MLHRQSGMRGLWLISAALLLQSCGAQWHLKRAIAKDPTIVQETKERIDTVIITEEKAVRDTIVLQRTDTTRIQRNGVRIKIKRIHDTIQIEAECLPDTIRVVKEISVPTVVYKEKKPTFGLVKLFTILVILLILVNLTRAFKP
jgi:hypothetical protein